MRLELSGFAPDLDPATPGIVTDCNAIIPSTQGLAAARSVVTAGLPALATTPNSAFVAELLSGSKRTFAASTTKIYEASGGAWVDRSRVGNYSGTNRTRFAVFGDICLATNRTEIIGAASAGGAFADIAGAPAAQILVTASGFVMALNINGMGMGDAPDAWGCSALRDHTSWTPSVTTQCAAGRLLDSPGAIKAGAALGSDVVAYKNGSMYLGRYVGPPLVWAWQRIPGDVGCSGAESLVVVGSRHFFIGPSDIYTFDGTVPQPIGAPVREYFFADLHQTYRDQIIGVSDTARDLVYWYYASVASTTGAIDSCLVYNYRTNKWGKWAVSIEAALQYSSGQVSYDGLGALYSTYDDLPSIAYDSPFWLADSTVPGVFQSSTLYSLTGTPGASWLTTCDFGDMTQFSLLGPVKPRFRQTPTASTATNFYREELGDTKTQDTTIAISRGKYDFRRAALWHSVRMDFTGAVAINGIDVEMAPAGSRRA